MICEDYSPSKEPTVDQQHDALRKGLGRAVLWSRSGRLDRDLLLDACLRDLRYDRQIEEPRGHWLWEMIESRRVQDFFRVPLLRALENLTDERSAHQLCVLAQHYAATGDNAFRDRLYEIVEQRPNEQLELLGEDELLALDGETAFRFIARVRGRRLATREWSWADTRFVEQGIEKFGRERVDQLFDEWTAKAVRRFRDGWRQHQQSESIAKPRQSYEQRLASITVEEIFRTAETTLYGANIRGWGKQASEVELNRVLERLWSEHDPKTLANLLSAFQARALPVFDSRLIELCRHDDSRVRERALSALEPNAHPEVRAFALSELRRGLRDGRVVSLLNRNYQPGDEERILNAVELPIDVSDRHWLMLQVVEFLDMNPTANCSKLGVISYALNPCGHCRYSAVRLLVDRRAAPEWMADECRSDSYPAIRSLIASHDGRAAPR